MIRNLPKLTVLLMLFAVLPFSLRAQTAIWFESFENRTAFTNNWMVASDYSEEENRALWGIVPQTFGSQGSRTGTNKAYCAGIGYQVDGQNVPYYPDLMSTYMEREIDLLNFSSATVTFWYKALIYKDEDEGLDEFFNDYMLVSINESDEIFDTTWLEAPVTKWTRMTLDLSEYAGTVCTIRFAFISDLSSQEDNTARGKGIYLDDVLITGYPKYRPDYNNDGLTDFLLHNVNDGRLATWLFTNQTQVGKVELLRGGKAVPLSWKVAGQADFDGNGQTDILWHNTGSSQVSVWLMNGTNVIRNIPLRNIALGWSVVTMGDFDSNRSQDIVWQHTDGRLAVWYMNGTNFLGRGLFDLPTSPGYKVVGTGDYNADGKMDLLFQRTGTGAVTTRLLNGTTRIGAVDFSLRNGMTYSPDWRVSGTQDMNGDRLPDLIMRHTDGSTAVWYLEGRSDMSEAALMKIVGQSPIRKAATAWKIAGHN